MQMRQVLYFYFNRAIYEVVKIEEEGSCIAFNYNVLLLLGRQ